MATIVRTKEGTYRVQIRRKGQKALSATFAKRSDAVDWGQKTEAALIERRFFPERDQHTLAEAIAKYTKEILPTYKPSTAEKKRQALAWWNERLGSTPLTALKASHILETLEPSFAPATRNAYCSHLSSVFTAAVRKWEWLQASPRIDRYQVLKKKIRILMDAERGRLLEECRQSRSKHLYAVVFLALTTGGRYKEILRLRWEDVDFEREIITFWKTKNSRVRSVPMAPMAKKVLQEHYQTWGEGAYLFPSSQNANQSTLWRAWDLARKRARLGDFRFHDLRHTFASYLAMSGASLFDIGELLGHEKMESTLIYTHLTEGHTRQVVERMAEKYF
jgi:integrase